ARVPLSGVPSAHLACGRHGYGKGGNMHKRAVVMTLLAVCGVATISIATLAPASGDEGGKVQFTDSSPVSESTFAQAYTSDFHRCTFNGTVTNVVSPCVVPVAPTEPTLGAFNDTLTGDFQGTGQFAGGAVLVADNDIAPATLDIPYELYEPYTLHVA